jgi:hypothetical protein
VADDIAYPYFLDEPLRDAEGAPVLDAEGNQTYAPDTRFWVRFKPVLLHGAYKRARDAARSSVGAGAAGRTEINADTLYELLWAELALESCLPDFVTGGTMRLCPEEYDKLPLYLVQWLSAEVDKRNGANLRAYQTVIQGKEADFRGPAPAPGAEQVVASVPSRPQRPRQPV